MMPHSVSCLNLHHPGSGPKVKYVSEQDAMVAWLKEVGSRPFRKGGWQARAREVQVYVCNHCGYMHLGHRYKP
jgi:hypothetical protein